VTGIATPGDVRLLRSVVEAERRRQAIGREDALAVLRAVPDTAPLFVRVPGRTIPDWLEPLLD
jgi:hypothetical protein